MYLIGFLSALNLLFSCNGKQFTFLFFQRTEKEKTSFFSLTFSHYFVQCCFVVVFHFVCFPGNKIHSRISFCVFEMLIFSKKNLCDYIERYEDKVQEQGNDKIMATAIVVDRDDDDEYGFHIKNLVFRLKKRTVLRKNRAVLKI